MTYAAHPRWGLPKTDREYLEARIDRSTGEQGCWPWLAYVSQYTGYGEVNRKGKRTYAHRLSWEVYVGPIPPGGTVDHRCRNRVCTNPQHLQVLSRSEHGKKDATFRWQGREK